MRNHCIDCSFSKHRDCLAPLALGQTLGRVTSASRKAKAKRSNRWLPLMVCLYCCLALLSVYRIDPYLQMPRFNTKCDFNAPLENCVGRYSVNMASLMVQSIFVFLSLYAIMYTEVTKVTLSTLLNLAPLLYRLR